MNLSGKTILITRAAHQAADFIRLVEQCGAVPLLFPTIDIVPPKTWDDCDRTIDALYMYDGLIFTSSNGVEFFFARMKERGVEMRDLKSNTVCVVGEKTKQAVEERGCTVTTMPEKFTALDLARTLQHDDLHNKTFLFPRGNLGNTILADTIKLLGGSVDTVTVYQTLKPKPEAVNDIRTKFTQRSIDVVTFTSPSTFLNFIELFTPEEQNAFLSKTTLAAIGPVTAKAIEDSGFKVSILPPISTIESLVQSIASYFQTTINNTESKTHS
jgi:uroporphyrinogen-III synthase